MAWQRAELVVQGEQAQALADALEEAGALSTELTDADAGTDDEQAIFGEPGADSQPWPRTRVSALFNHDFPVRDALARALRESGAQGEGEPAIERIEDADWVALTQRQFEPLQVGRNLWIVPTWYRPPRPEAVNVILDPGAAFGTGSHPTTRLCLDWLDRHLVPGSSMIDYGCGSGILAIAAAKLGAGPVVGVDIDAQAIRISRENARRNSVEIRFAHASEAPPDPARIVVANILSSPLKVLAPLFARLTAAGGKLVLSGILSAQAAEVADAYRHWFEVESLVAGDGWIRLSMLRTG